MSGDLLKMVIRFNPVFSAVCTVALFSIPAGAQEIYNSNDGSKSLSIFGRIESDYRNAAMVKEYKADENNSDEDKAELDGRSRIGISARSKITDWAKAIGFAEWEVGASTSQNGKWDTRYAYAGFDMNQYGTLVFGQGDTAKYLAAGFTDVFEDIGAKGQDYYDFGGRQEGQIMYAASVLGYTLSASYQTPQDNMGFYTDHETGTVDKININNGYALGLSYNWTKGPLTDTAVAISWDWYDLKDIRISDRHSLSLALSYGHLDDGLYTALLYTSSKYRYETHHTAGWEAVGGYGFESGISMMLGWGYRGYNFDQTDSSYLDASLSYKFNTSLKVFTEAEFGLGRLDDKYEGSHTDYHQNTNWQTGLIYSF